MISYEFFTGEDIFPVRVIAIYFIGINFILMALGRELVRLINRLLLHFGINRQKVLIIGNSERTIELAICFSEAVDYGYDVVGVVAREEFLPLRTPYRAFTKLKNALEETKPDVLIQTDLTRSEEIYAYAIENHLAYMFQRIHHIFSERRGAERFPKVFERRRGRKNDRRRRMYFLRRFKRRRRHPEKRKAQLNHGDDHQQINRASFDELHKPVLHSPSSSIIKRAFRPVHASLHNLDWFRFPKPPGAIPFLRLLHFPQQLP